MCRGCRRLRGDLSPVVGRFASGGSDFVAVVGNFVSDGRRFAPGLGMG